MPSYLPLLYLITISRKVY